MLFQSQKPNSQAWPVFVVGMLAFFILAHAVAFFLHEYAHSFTAWGLGWKANPLALHYGQPTIGNVVLQLQIDENVDYAPIFASSHARQAGTIAAAGVVLGNFLITYPLSRWGFARARRWGWALFWYWLGLASIGNFLCYVPMRVFSFREDMHTAAQGFGCPASWLLVGLGVPFGLAALEFLLRFMPAAIRALYPQAAGQRGVVAVFSTFLLFCFYGAAGWSNSGPLSHQLSVLSVAGLFPALALTELLLVRRSLLPAAAIT